MGPCKYMIGVAFLLSVLSCEVLDNDIEKHEGKDVIICVELDEVAEVLSDLPLNLSHMQEVHDAVTSSSMNGYDEEYTMRILFESPGKGVGDIATRSGVTYKEPLRNLIESYVRECFQFFSIEDNVCCGFVIYSFYYVESILKTAQNIILVIGLFSMMMVHAVSRA